MKGMETDDGRRPCARARRYFQKAAMGLLFLSIVQTANVSLQGHHILGIPHYKYGDDYPQIPYLEVVAQVGPTDLDFTYFPGRPKPGEAVRFKLYIHNRQTGEPFREPLKVEAFQVHFLSGATLISKPLTIRTGSGPEKNDYKFYLTFPQAEAYQLQLHFPTADGVEVISFPVTIGETDDRPLVLGAAGLLGLAILSVASVKKHQKRRARRRRGGR